MNRDWAGLVKDLLFTRRSKWLCEERELTLAALADLFEECDDSQTASRLRKPQLTIYLIDRTQLQSAISNIQDGIHPQEVAHRFAIDFHTEMELFSYLAGMQEMADMAGYSHYNLFRTRDALVRYLQDIHQGLMEPNE